MLKISFDFDSCLSEKELSPLVRLLNSVCDVYIVTSRCAGNYNKDVIELALELGIKKDHIYYTEGAFKVDMLHHLEIDFHFDDMEDEVMKINQSKSKTQAFLFGLKDPQMLAYLFNP